jgi:hypothetical protein
MSYMVLLPWRRHRHLTSVCCVVKQGSPSIQDRKTKYCRFLGWDYGTQSCFPIGNFFKLKNCRSKKVHYRNLENSEKCWVQWLMPVILATCEAEIRRIKVWGLSEQKILETSSQPKKKGGCGGEFLSSQLRQEVQNRRIVVSSWPGQKARADLQNKQSKMGWRRGSGGGALA